MTARDREMTPADEAWIAETVGLVRSLEQQAQAIEARICAGRYELRQQQRHMTALEIAIEVYRDHQRYAA
jgi:hypothetical protein